MRKITRLLVTILVISVLMFGCGSADKDATVADSESQQNVTEDDIKESEQNSEDTTTANENTDENIAIKGQELFSYDGLTVTMKDVTYEKLWNEGIEVTLENTSAEQYTVKCENVDFNDYTCSAIFKTNVKAGETIEQNILVWGQPELFGAEEVAQISLYFNVIDSSLNTVYDSGEVLLKTSKSDEIQIVKPDGGDVIYEGDNIYVTSLGLIVDEEHNYSLGLFVENNRDELIKLSCSKALVNGEEIETLYNANVSPNKMNYNEFIFYSEMSSYEITDIEKIEICFEIYNPDTWELIDNSDVISVPVKMAE